MPIIDHTAEAIHRSQTKVTGVEIDEGFKCVRFADKVCRLRPKDLAMLKHLVEASPRPVHHKTLYDALYWQRFDGGPSLGIVKVHICLLRKKLAEAGIPVAIYTSHSFGYWAEMAAAPAETV